MTTTLFPYAVTTAFNPVLLGVNLSEAEQYDEIRVAVISGDKRHFVDNEFSDGYAELDLSGALKQFFAEHAGATTPPTAQTSINQLFALKYDIQIGVPVLDDEGNEEINVITTLYDYIAVNSVVQIGKSSNLAVSDKYLTDLAEQYVSDNLQIIRRKKGLKKYAGYPLSVCYLNIDRATYMSFDDHTPVNYFDPIEDVLFEIEIPDGVHILHSTENAVFEPLTTNQDEIITTNAGEIIWVHTGNPPGIVLAINITPQCTPDNPFYVRWLNQLGGWEYFMFSFRQSIEKSVDNQQFFYPFVRNQETAKGYIRASWMDGKERITAGAGLLSGREYEALSKIIYSPQIEWYSKDLGKWFTLTIDESSINRDTRNETGSVEITFNLPVPQLQF
ncbi:MAG: hypothetical protein LBH19_02395 [Dysgonamonadaceae bacterium]|jgi:hypothetical protein|nr:hypothetical protein [Dysgonamonadaceae bacterium]